MVPSAGKKQDQHKNKDKQRRKWLKTPRTLWFIVSVARTVYQVGKWVLEMFPDIFE